jgi:hypothetical protein
MFMLINNFTSCVISFSDMFGGYSSVFEFVLRSWRLKSRFSQISSDAGQIRTPQRRSELRFQFHSKVPKCSHE